MPKTFYTERDIEDLSKRGVVSLVEDDDVVLTDFAGGFFDFPSAAANFSICFTRFFSSLLIA